MNNKRVALITGANKGIGFETARQLGRQNITALIGARGRAKGDEAAKQLQDGGIDAHAIEIDVASSNSIARAAEQVQRERGRLDILINNAGVMLHGEDKSAGTQPLEVWRRTFETNLFGLIETTRAFLPLLRKSEAGRIVNLSSILGSIAYHSQPGSPIYGYHVPAYNVSKAAVNAFTVQLAHELRDTRIKVNAAHPGWVKTDLGGEGAPMEVEEGARTSVQLATIGEDGPSGAYVHLGKPLPW